MSPYIAKRMRRVVCGLSLLVLLTACRSIDGSWSMTCKAFAGDRLSFEEGRYTWDKFTDARRVDDQGGAVDPFPGFPRTGPFTRDDDVIVLMDDGDGSEVARFYLHRRDGVVLLLSAEEHEGVMRGEAFPDCPLRRDEGN